MILKGWFYFLIFELWCMFLFLFVVAQSVFAFDGEYLIHLQKSLITLQLHNGWPVTCLWFKARKYNSSNSQAACTISVVFRDDVCGEHIHFYSIYLQLQT